MDFVVASIGVLQSLITSSVFQVIIKCLIGGLRPHFLAACKPVIPYDPSTHSIASCSFVPIPL
jgi:diacylglycerol diphosphate phosphatase / phosphatidate phosphatase